MAKPEPETTNRKFGLISFLQDSVCHIWFYCPQSDCKVLQRHQSHDVDLAENSRCQGYQGRYTSIILL